MQNASAFFRHQQSGTGGRQCSLKRTVVAKYFHPAEEVLVPSSSLLLSDQFANQQMAPPVKQSDFLLDCQPKFPEASHQQMEEIEPATPSEKFVFPNVVVAEIISVQSNGNATLKIILEEMSGQQKELCPSRPIILLPLHSIEEQWGMVALDRIPKSGFRVPGLSVLIPGELLGRAASAAVERKTGICFPFRFQTKKKTIALNPVCGIYGIPELPRHVFVGPFPANHFNKFPPQRCVALITPKKPVPSDTVCSKEPTTSAETAQQEFSEDRDRPSSPAESELLEATQSQIADADGVENEKKEKGNEEAVEDPPSPSGPLNSKEILKNDSVENVKLQTLAYRALQEEENGIDQLKKSNSTDDSNSAVGRQNENRVKLNFWKKKQNY